MKKLLRKLFLVKEIKSKQGDLHFRRWRLFWTPWTALYIHQIFRSDDDFHSHSHPWSFLSLILAGGYREYSEFNEYRTVKPGQVVFHHAKDFHRIMLNKPTTTLVCTFGKYRPWGYCVRGIVIDNDTYRQLKKKDKI